MIRASTTAPGDQPATIRDLANGPEVPNAALDASIATRPSPRWRRIASTMVSSSARLPSECQEQSMLLPMTVRALDVRSQDDLHL